MRRAPDAGVLLALTITLFQRIRLAQSGNARNLSRANKCHCGISKNLQARHKTHSQSGKGRLGSIVLGLGVKGHRAITSTGCTPEGIVRRARDIAWPALTFLNCSLLDGACSEGLPDSLCKVNGWTEGGYAEMVRMVRMAQEGVDPGVDGSSKEGLLYHLAFGDSRHLYLEFFIE